MPRTRGAGPYKEAIAQVSVPDFTGPNASESADAINSAILGMTQSEGRLDVEGTTSRSRNNVCTMDTSLRISAFMSALVLF